MLAGQDLRKQADPPRDGRASNNQLGRLSRVDTSGTHQQHGPGLVRIEQSRGRDAGLDQAHTNGRQGHLGSHAHGKMGQALAQVGQLGRPGC